MSWGWPEGRSQKTRSNRRSGLFWENIKYRKKSQNRFLHFYISSPVENSIAQNRGGFFYKKLNRPKNFGPAFLARAGRIAMMSRGPICCPILSAMARLPSAETSTDSCANAAAFRIRVRAQAETPRRRALQGNLRALCRKTGPASCPNCPAFAQVV